MRRLVFALAISLAAAPAVWAASDQETAQQIADALKTSGRMKGYSIGIKYKDGTARLEGTVRSQEQLEAALEIVERSPDVKRVINNLTVSALPAGPSAPNAPANPPVQAAVQPAVQQAAAQPSTAMHQATGGAVRGLTSIFRRASSPSPATNPASHAQASALIPAQVQPTPAQAAPQPTAGPASPSAAAAVRTPAQGGPVPVQPVAAAGPQVAAQAQMRPMMPLYQVGQAMPPQGYGQARPIGYPSNLRAMSANYQHVGTAPVPEYVAHTGVGVAPAVYDQPHLPAYSWPSYAPHPNYAALTYPKQYSPTAWPYIGPFYPYPQVPLGWRKVTLEWDDGWWFLNFADDRRHCGHLMY
jgi:hypothetical protein